MQNLVVVKNVILSKKIQQIFNWGNVIKLFMHVIYIYIYSPGMEFDWNMAYMIDMLGLFVVLGIESWSFELHFLQFIPSQKLTEWSFVT